MTIRKKEKIELAPQGSKISRTRTSETLLPIDISRKCDIVAIRKYFIALNKKKKKEREMNISLMVRFFALRRWLLLLPVFSSAQEGHL